MSKVLVVAGMHRSGTSLTAGWLHKCGISMGVNLMTGGFGNPKGHFEDWKVVNIHQNYLKRIGLHTTGLRLKNHTKLELDEIAIKEIEELVLNRNNFNQWAWKEPRGTLFLSDWKKIIPELKCVAVYRHYNKVIDSLKRRIYHSIFKTDKFSPINRLKLKISYPFYIRREINNYAKAWIVYNKSIIDFKNKYPEDCLIFNVGDLISDNQLIFDLIARSFDFELNYYGFDDFYEKKLMKDDEVDIKISKSIFKELETVQIQLEKFNSIQL